MQELSTYSGEKKKHIWKFCFQCKYDRGFYVYWKLSLNKIRIKEEICLKHNIN